MPDVHLDKVDLEHMKRGLENYEGDLRRDLLQPYNPDGTVSKKFVETYGTSFYEKVKNGL